MILCSEISLISITDFDTKPSSILFDYKSEYVRCFRYVLVPHHDSHTASIPIIYKFTLPTLNLDTHAPPHLILTGLSCTKGVLMLGSTNSFSTDLVPFQCFQFFAGGERSKNGINMPSLISMDNNVIHL